MLLEWEGSQPKETSEIYHLRDNYVSSSDIKWMDKSPWHYKRYVIDGLKLDTTSVSFGTLAHEIVFEDRINELTCLPNFSPMSIEVEGKRPGATKKQTVTIKEQVAHFKEQNQHKKIVTENEFNKLTGMHFALSFNELAQEYINPSDLIEETFLYHDAYHGIDCRFRPDRINLEKGYCVDYKTTANAKEHAFKWAIIKYGYHISAAHYMLGLERLCPGKIKEFVFIAQETSEPYACGVYRLSKVDLEMGKDIRDHLITKIKKHKELDFWPQYNSEIIETNLPDVTSEETYEA
jgi:hypothetical protein